MCIACYFEQTVIVDIFVKGLYCKVTFIMLVAGKEEEFFIVVVSKILIWIDFCIECFVINVIL